MSDDTQAVEAVTAVEVPAELAAVETTVAPEVPADQSAETKPAVKAEDDDAPIPKGVQKRIDRAIRRQYEAEAEAKYLREQIARQQVTAPPAPTVPEDVTPKLEDFQDYESYLKAAAKHEARQELQQQLSIHAKTAEQERAQAAQRQTADSWNKKVEAVTAELPDFADVVGSSSVPMPDHVKAVVMQSDAGPKLAYYLATHPDEAEQIASQHPLQAIRSLVRIEDKIQAEKSVKKATDAPAPITPVGTKAKSEKSPEDMSFNEFAEWRKKQIAQRR